jgi:H/ACA ribonucleoprotein complex subunit 2
MGEMTLMTTQMMVREPPPQLMPDDVVVGVRRDWQHHGAAMRALALSCCCSWRRLATRVARGLQIQWQSSFLLASLETTKDMDPKDILNVPRLVRVIYVIHCWVSMTHECSVRHHQNQKASTTMADEAKQPKAKKKRVSVEAEAVEGATAAAAASTPKTATATVVPSYEERCEAVNAIAQPLASKKSTKKAHKLVKKAASLKHIRRGVKEVVKGLRKGERGLAILAGDIYPIDVISHLPVLLEEANIPYLYVPSKMDLGAAASTKRPTSCVLIRTPKSADFDGHDLYDALCKEAQDFDPTTVVR